MTQIDINNFNDFNPRMWYRIRNTHLPSTHTLDVINDAREASTGLLNLAPEAHYSGQYWQITSIGAGLYSLRTLWLGPHRVLDVRDEDGKPVLLHRSERREQCWRIRPWGDGSWAIVNAQSGEERCVDLVVQEGRSRAPVVMKPVDGQSATQKWYITAAWPIGDEQD